MKYILLMIFMAITCSCLGQDQEEKNVTIYTLEDEVFFGKLLSISSDSLVIDHQEFGILRVARSDIKTLYDGKRQTQSTNALSEPYYVPTGIANGEGNHYYRNYALFGNNFSYGMNDHMDISFGFETASLLLNNSSFSLPITQLGIRFSGSIAENFHLGFSTRALFNADGGVVLVSVPFTVGGKRTNFTFAPTAALLIGEDDRDFTALFNASIALSRKLRLITDGLYTEGILLGTTMLEITTNSRPVICLGIIYTNGFNLLPNASITIPFGKKAK
jgi:hypothetical protein